MWQTIMRYAVKVAVFAAEHPDQVRAAINDVEALAKAAKK